MNVKKLAAMWQQRRSTDQVINPIKLIKPVQKNENTIKEVKQLKSNNVKKIQQKIESPIKQKTNQMPVKKEPIKQIVKQDYPKSSQAINSFKTNDIKDIKEKITQKKEQKIQQNNLKVNEKNQEKQKQIIKQPPTQKMSVKERAKLFQAKKSLPIVFQSAFTSKSVFNNNLTAPKNNQEGLSKSAQILTSPQQEKKHHLQINKEQNQGSSSSNNYNVEVVDYRKTFQQNRKKAQIMFANQRNPEFLNKIIHKQKDNHVSANSGQNHEQKQNKKEQSNANQNKTLNSQNFKGKIQLKQQTYHYEDQNRFNLQPNSQVSKFQSNQKTIQNNTSEKLFNQTLKKSEEYDKNQQKKMPHLLNGANNDLSLQTRKTKGKRNNKIEFDEV